jgi:hypothetical protein
VENIKHWNQILSTFDPARPQRTAGKAQIRSDGINFTFTAFRTADALSSSFSAKVAA